MTHRKKLAVFLVMLIVDAVAVFLSYAFFLEQMLSMLPVPLPSTSASPVLLGLANAGIVLVAYGLLGLAGYWLARKLGLPGIWSPEGGARRWITIPMALGLVSGLILVVGDLLFAPINGFGRFVHPGFPASIFASLTAGIGEEILFRGLVFGLWATILSWLLRRIKGGRTVALWLANLVAALGFGAGHLGTVFLLTGASHIADVNPVLLVEVFLLNGIVGLLAGWRYMKDGLVAASGVHFWTDIVFHVLWGLVG